jgi:hypothetical protein
LDPSVYQVEIWYGYHSVLTLDDVLARTLVLSANSMYQQLSAGAAPARAAGTKGSFVHVKSCLPSPFSLVKLGRTPIRASPSI